jgi:hypothetical protein
MTITLCQTARAADKHRRVSRLSQRPAQSRLCLALFAFLTCALGACGQSPSNSIAANDRTIARQTLEAAPSHGFGEHRFSTDDNRLGEEIVAYAEAQRGVDRNPATVDPSWGMRGERYDASGEFSRAEASGGLGGVLSGGLQAWIASLPPPSAQYGALRTAFARYRQIVQAGGWAQLPPGPPLHAGASGPNVLALRQRLAAEAQLAQTPRPDYFDAGLGAAVRNAQLRYGLASSGVLDDATLRALNVSAETRLMQIKANLQRWRWAPRNPSGTRVDVNVPTGAAAYYVANVPRLEMRVAVGRPGDETPMLTSVITSIVINPPWNVPDSIAERELLPREQREPGYLAAHGFVQISDNGQTRLQQSAGPQSALGAVKFVFENSYGVYLHDTPSRATFAQAQRSVSHGCVRLERAVDLASMVLGNQGWSEERLRQTIAAGQTTEVKLDRSIPVRIFYWTAWVNNGQVYFRDDIYGWDEATAALSDGVVRRPPAIEPADTAMAASSPPTQATTENDDYLPQQTLDSGALRDESASEAQGTDTTSEQAAPPKAPN